MHTLVVFKLHFLFCFFFINPGDKVADLVRLVCFLPTYILDWRTFVSVIKCSSFLLQRINEFTNAEVSSFSSSSLFKVQVPASYTTHSTKLVAFTFQSPTPKPNVWAETRGICESRRRSPLNRWRSTRPVPKVLDGVRKKKKLAACCLLPR